MMTTACVARRWVFLVLLAACAPAMAQSASLSLADGKIILLRGVATYSIEVGAKLETGDMIETGAKGQAQMEFADGLILNLGPQSKLYLLNIAADPAKAAQLALASGWLKAAVPAGRKGTPRDLQYLLLGLEIDTKDATVVLHAASPADEVFIESGQATAGAIGPDGTAGQAVTLKGSDYASRKDAAVVIGRPPTGFFGSVPRHYMDNLPALYAKVKDLQREPVREHDTTYAEAAAWLEANKTVRAGLLARYQPRAKDAEFRSALLATMSAHPEWEHAVGSAKNK